MSSRTELVGWVNDLLQISYTKIEQLGAGGAFCQIIDSIYGLSSSLRPSSYARLLRVRF
jgi:hypothetical protein